MSTLKYRTGISAMSWSTAPSMHKCYTCLYYCTDTHCCGHLLLTGRVRERTPSAYELRAWLEEHPGQRPEPNCRSWARYDGTLRRRLEKFAAEAALKGESYHAEDSDRSGRAGGAGDRREGAPCDGTGEVRGHAGGGDHGDAAGADDVWRLAAALRARRMELGLQQKQVAALCGIPQSALSAYERGGSPVPDDRRQALEKALDFTAEQYVPAEPEKKRRTRGEIEAEKLRRQEAAAGKAAARKEEGAALRARRVALGLTQRQLSELSALPVKVLSSYESGTCRVPPARRELLEEKLLELERGGIEEFRRALAERERQREQAEQARRQELAAWIKVRRSELGLTRAQLADAAGVGLKLLGRWERAAVYPMPKMIRALERVLGEYRALPPGLEPEPENAAQARQAYAGWMKARRSELGLTQKQVAELCGIPNNTLSIYESAQHMPPPERRAAIERVLGER